jgi:hypothetical protein
MAFWLNLTHTAKDTVTKIGKKYSQKGNCAATDPIYTFIYNVSYFYIPTIGLPFWLQQNLVDLSWEYVNRSQMYEYGNREQGRAV